MNLRLVDSHAHVQFPAYDQDRGEVIARALEAGIGMVNIGTQSQTSADAVALAARYPAGVWATVGFHPNHVTRDTYHDPWELREKQPEEFDISKFRNLALHPKVVAIGECGLDFYRSPKGQRAEVIGQRQRDVFLAQIELAREVRKPLVVHCRNAFSDLISILDSCFKIHPVTTCTPIPSRWGGGKNQLGSLEAPALRPGCNGVHDLRLAGVVHFFSGSWEDARKLLDLGFYLGFGGVITFAREYDEVVKKAPLERILVETDAPYVAPVPYRGERNEPAYIVEAVRKIAELHGVSRERVTTQTTANARTLFGI